MTELRCPNTMHGILDVDKDHRSKSSAPTADAAQEAVLVVLHKFSLC
jgi:hypothetical protein